LTGPVPVGDTTFFRVVTRRLSKISLPKRPRLDGHRGSSFVDPMAALHPNQV